MKLAAKVHSSPRQQGLNRPSLEFARATLASSLVGPVGIEPTTCGLNSDVQAFPTHRMIPSVKICVNLRHNGSANPGIYRLLGSLTEERTWHTRYQYKRLKAPPTQPECSGYARHTTTLGQTYESKRNLKLTAWLSRLDFVRILRCEN